RSSKPSRPRSARADRPGHGPPSPTRRPASAAPYGCSRGGLPLGGGDNDRGAGAGGEQRLVPRFEGAIAVDRDDLVYLGRDAAAGAATGDHPGAALDEVTGAQRGEELDHVIGSAKALIATLAQGQLGLQVGKDLHGLRARRGAREVTGVA